MRLINYILILKIIYTAADTDNFDDLESFDTPQSITIYHQLLDNTYSYRGVINIYDPSSFASNVQQSSLTKNDYNLLNSLAENDDMYKLKYLVKSKAGKENTFYSFLKASKIIQCNLTDIVEILIDQSTSQIISFNHVVPRKAEESFTNRASPTQPNYNFKTTVKFNTVEKGPVPDVTTFLAKLQREKDARKAAGKDNRPFLAKYWYYIVPALIVFLFAGSPVANQEGGGR